MADLIYRQAAIDAFGDVHPLDYNAIAVRNRIKALPSAQSERKTERWIPCSERLPETTDPVIITWVNHKPEWYYEHIKGKPFVATGHYYNGRWYWFSDVCQDSLNEYGDCEMDRIDSAVEVVAWMPLPEAYEGGTEDGANDLQIM